MYGGIYLGPWPIANWSDEAREAIEGRALYEARLATSDGNVANTTYAGFLARVRGALGRRPPSSQACACPA